MKLLRLTGGTFAIVDDQDYHWLNKWKWGPHEDGSAVRRKTDHSVCATSFLQRMHREIMGLNKGDKRVVDHKNGCRFDNRRVNLRVCQQSENLLNKRTNRHNKLGLKGVEKNGNRFCAYIRLAGKKKYLGIFATAELAYEFASLARCLLHGEFARHA